MTKNGISLISVLEKRHIYTYTHHKIVQNVSRVTFTPSMCTMCTLHSIHKIPTRGGNKQLNYSPQQEKTHSRCMYESFRFRTMIAV